MEIIPGLLDDLAIECLARVPYRFHLNLRAVSKTWNALLSCPDFFKVRQHHGECEEGVVSLHKRGQTESDFDVIIYYPRGQWSERLPQIPRELKLQYTEYYRCRFVRSKQQLVVMGFLNSCSDRECVLIFDFLSRKWLLGADMPCNLCYFVCAASATEGLFYVAGGWHMPYIKSISRRFLIQALLQAPYLLEAFVYNVEENSWDFLPPLNSDPLLKFCAGTFLDGKFYVVPKQSQAAQVYDPHTRLWKNINKDGNAQYVHNCVDAIRGTRWFTWEEFMRGWINVKEFDVARTSSTRVGQYPAQNPVVYGVVERRGKFYITAIDSNNRVVYYRFDARENKWSQFRMSNNRYIFSSPSVQIR